MIEEPPLLTIARNFTRPAPELVRAFAGLPTGWLVDAQDGGGALDHRIKPVSGKGFAGVALTCRCGPADNLALFGALAEARAGDVLVAATDAYLGTAVTGDLLVGMAKNRGVAAIVTDGAVRDVAGIVGFGLPVYCAAVTPNSPVRNGPGTVGLAVTLGGVAIASGDILVGDPDGVVVVPQAAIAAVLRRLEAVRAAEAALEAKVKAGLEVPDFIAAVLSGPQTRYLD